MSMPAWKPLLTLRTSKRPSRSSASTINSTKSSSSSTTRIFRRPAIESVGRNAVVTHKGVQLLTWDTSKTAARHTKSLELTGVEATDDRLLANLTDFGRFACGENGLHDGTTSLLSRWFANEYSRQRTFTPMDNNSVRTSHVMVRDVSWQAIKTGASNAWQTQQKNFPNSRGPLILLTPLSW